MTQHGGHWLGLPKTQPWNSAPAVPGCWKAWHRASQIHSGGVSLSQPSSFPSNFLPRSEHSYHRPQHCTLRSQSQENGKTGFREFPPRWQTFQGQAPRTPEWVRPQRGAPSLTPLWTTGAEAQVGSTRGLLPAWDSPCTPPPNQRQAPARKARHDPPLVAPAHGPEPNRVAEAGGRLFQSLLPPWSTPSSSLWQGAGTGDPSPGPCRAAECRGKAPLPS